MYSKELLLDIIAKEYRRLTERLTALTKDPTRVDIMEMAIKDCNSIASMFRTIVNHEEGIEVDHDPKPRKHEYSQGRNKDKCAYCGKDRLDDGHEQP